MESLDRTARRKLRKETRRLAKGNLQAASVLSQADIARLYGGATASFQLICNNKKSKAHVTLDELQCAVLWQFLLSPTPNWLTVRNKALVTNVCLVLTRGATFRSFATSLSEQPAGFSMLTDPSLVAAAVTKMPRSGWTTEKHDHVRSMDDSLLRLPSSSKGGSAANHPLLSKSKTAPANAQAALDRILSLCCSKQELVLNGLLSVEDDLKHGIDTTTSSLSMNGKVFTKTALRDLRYSAVVVAAASTSSSSSSSTTAAAAASPPATPLLPDGAPILPRLLSVDAEMCLTGSNQFQIARVTVTDEEDATLLDTIVKPEKPVVDCLTQYSGITHKMLQEATTTMDQVREKLVSLLDGDDGDGSPAILVGHSVENDLIALGLVHTRIIDTSLVYSHPSGLPYRHALRHLSKVHLGREIQAGHGTTGHCAEEDCIATMHLVQRVVYGHENVGEDASVLKAELEEEAFDSATAAATASTKAAKVKATKAAPPESASKEESGDTTAVGAKRARASDDSNEDVDNTSTATGPTAGKRARLGEKQGEESIKEGNAPASTAEITAGTTGNGNQNTKQQTKKKGGRKDLFLTVAFNRPARPDFIPEGTASWQKQQPQQQQQQPRVTQGVASVAAALLGDAATATAEVATASSSSAAAPPRRSNYHSSSLGKSIFTKEEFSSKDVCAGISLIGSQSFVQSNLASAASGIVVNPSSGSTKVLETASKELQRYDSMRKEGKAKGLGFVVAEIEMPRKKAKPSSSSSSSSAIPLPEVLAVAGGGSGGGAGAMSSKEGEEDIGLACDWEAFNRQMATFRESQGLPAGTAVIVVCQGDLDGKDGVTREQSTIAMMKMRSPSVTTTATVSGDSGAAGSSGTSFTSSPSTFNHASLSSFGGLHADVLASSNASAWGMTFFFVSSSSSSAAGSEAREGEEEDGAAAAKPTD
jgi:DNA polymerase III epsilon subunit-like protein